MHSNRNPVDSESKTSAPPPKIDRPTPPMPEVHEPESIEEAAIVAGEEPDGYIERVMYAPPDPDWKSSEETVLARLEEANTAIEATLEDEPVGIDDLLNAPPGTGTASGAATAAFTLREEGLEEAALWVIQISQRVVAGSLAIDEAQRMVRDRAQEISDAAPISAIALSTFAEQLGIAEKDVVMGAKMQVSSRGEIKKGYDLVRWGNIGDVAFFHAREEGRVDGEIPAQRMQLVEHVAEALSDLALTLALTLVLTSSLTIALNLTHVVEVLPIEDLALPHRVDRSHLH